MLDLDIDNLESDMKAGSTAAFDLHDYAEMQAFDDQSGDTLDPPRMQKARLEEMDYFKSMQMNEKVRGCRGHRPETHSGVMGR